MLGTKAYRLAAVIALIGTLLLASLTPASVRAEPNGGTALQDYVLAMQPGWNLGNTFEASGSETSWGNPPVTEDFIRAIASEGYRSIRIPITWNHRMGSAPDYAIQTEFMNRIQEVVDWALEAELYVMINLHHDSHWIVNMESEHDQVMDKFNAVWQQIAAHFRDYPDKLMFESINEPRFSEDWSKDAPVYFAMLDELNTAFHRIVRDSGGMNGERPLVIPSITANHSQARLDAMYETIDKLDDPNLIATIHYYGLYSFSVNLGGSTTFDDEARTDLEQAFDRAHDTFVARGIPVIVGEFGLLGFDKSVDTISRGEILKYLEYITYYSREKKLPLMLWDNGQHFDRHAFEWKNPDMFEVMHKGWSGRSSNAETDALYLKQGEEIQDAAILMHMNGNTLSEIRHGGQVLQAGIDYSLEGDRLTIASALLRSLVPESPGSYETLTCVFSAGADWNIRIIRYDTPMLREIEGTRGLFVIPVKYNGDRLATMEAVYANGGNAGPDDWTSYKEFGKAFEPDYDANLVKLTSAFFDQVEDGEVLINLHFWSGEAVGYKLSVAGNKIIGNPLDDEGITAADSEEPGTPTESNGDSSDLEAVDQPALDSETREYQAYILAGIAAVVVTLLLVAGIKRKSKFRK